MTSTMTIDLRRVAATAATCFVAVFMLATAIPASATASFWIPSEWTADPDYHLGYRHSGYTGSNFTNAVQSADDPWDNVGSSWLDFNWGGTDTSVFTWQDACLSPDGVFVGTAAITPLGREKTCTNSGNMRASNIAIDRTGRNWEFGPANASSNEWDMRSVLVHEFGHAAGWVGHFAGSSRCPNTSADQTMCAALGLGEEHWRTLESDDEFEVGLAY